MGLYLRLTHVEVRKKFGVIFFQISTEIPAKELRKGATADSTSKIVNQISIDIENLLCYNDSSGAISLELTDLDYEYNWSTYENLDDGSVNVIASGVDEIDNNFII